MQGDKSFREIATCEDHTLVTTIGPTNSNLLEVNL